MKINRNEYRDKVLACWMGKNIGGTLGAPFEWRRQVNDVSFYTQDLGGEPLPNDDLDIQLLWLVAMEEQGVEVDAHTLAEYWMLYVTPHWAEYGTAKANMRAGLPPPLCGSHRNVYRDSCGAFIRSEIWACIAPGCPSLAAAYAREDAILDHGDGEGTFGEIFFAALESAAFLLRDVDKLIGIGLSYIPAESGVAQAVRCAVEAHKGGLSWRAARDKVLAEHRGGTFGGNVSRTSPEDRRKGFHEGRLGYDVPSNAAITILGLLYGEGDFGRTVCTAVNCGEDTDCTAATVGSIFGILHGTAGIPARWIEPIGRRIKTVAINLGDLGSGRRLPQTVDELTDRTERLAQQVLLRRRDARVAFTEGPTDLSDLKDADELKQRLGAPSPCDFLGATVHRFDFFTVAVDYGGSPTIRDGESKRLTVTLRNEYRVQAALCLNWRLPEGWAVSPAAVGAVLCLPPHYEPPPALDFVLRADRVRETTNRAVLEISTPGRPLAMLVPVVLLNGNLSG